MAEQVSASPSRISFDGVALSVVPDAFVGAVDATALTKRGASFVGWALSNPNLARAVTPPAKFLFVKGEHVTIAVDPNSDRVDLARKFGPATLRCGINVELDLDLLPKPFLPSLDVYAFDGREEASRLRVVALNNQLSQIAIATGADFFRLIQTPSTRLRDPATLVYASLHTLQRFPDDFAVRASATCVIGYRLLERSIADGEIVAKFEMECAELLVLEPNIERGLFVRWHTSLRLIAGYYSFQKGDKLAARIHFDAIPQFAADLEWWPSALTNILIGVYVSGYLAFEPGMADQAIERWEAAEGILRHGAAVAKFTNYYAYGELVNAVQVARECRVAAMVARNGGPLHDVSVAPEGIGLDPRTVPGPIGALEAQCRALTGEGDALAAYRGIRPPR